MTEHKTDGTPCGCKASTIIRVPDIKKLQRLIGVALGEASALFMSQEIKGTEIEMPSNSLSAIGERLANDIIELI